MRTPEAAPAPARRSLVFWILPVQAPVLGATLARAFSTALPGVDVQFVERERGADYGAALQKGEVDVTIMFADTAYLAFVGQLGGEPYDRLRGIATLNPNPLYLLVRRGSAIRQLADLQKAAGWAWGASGEPVLLSPRRWCSRPSTSTSKNRTPRLATRWPRWRRASWTPCSSAACRRETRFARR